MATFVYIGALRNFAHFGGYLINGYRKDRHFEIALDAILLTDY
jgi:hypothetical protein